MSIDLSALATAGTEVKKIPVHINYDIIRLFSEGLYRSPHKAIEELVSNGYDAGADRVHVLLPQEPENTPSDLGPLWTIDNGHGMDASGFAQLWRVAESNKDAPLSSGREPIGQFGIGKLAAYVLAWRLTHISCVDGTLLLTTMNFHNVLGRQNAEAQPVHISLRQISESEAKLHLAEIEHRDPAAWSFMFHATERAPTWTAAALTDFKSLYHQLSAGRLRWVLSTALPLESNFRIFLDGAAVLSSKLSLPVIKQIPIQHTIDAIGEIRGTARIYEKQLTTGKAANLGRSNGFFVRVRGRVINLEDELFGVSQPNHAAWSRFALDVDADGLRDYLLSSREGVRDNIDVQEFRRYLLELFNQCRAAYDDWNRRDQGEIDLTVLLSDGPSAHVLVPLIRSVCATLEHGAESFYIGVPKDVQPDDRAAWLEEYTTAVSTKPVTDTRFVKHGINAPALRYDPDERILYVNVEHPFVDKLTNGDKQRNPARLFASSELLLEGQLQEQGVAQDNIANLLRDRDRVLRLTGGELPPTANEVLRRLAVASQDSVALERAVGGVFALLGFDYERRGGNKPGPDGVLFARLGRHRTDRADYRVVYDAKQSNQPAVPADKVDLAQLEEFRNNQHADFGFFVAHSYAAENNPTGILNRKIATETAPRVTLLKINHLQRLVGLHLTYGVTLSELRGMFEVARTVPDVDAWLAEYGRTLAQRGVLNLRTLLWGLEQEKADTLATPNVVAVRTQHPELQGWTPDQLVARLKALESIVGPHLLEVEEDSRDVLMHQTADQILNELDRRVRDMESNANSRA